MTSAAVSAAPLRVVHPAPAPLAIEVTGVTKRFGQRRGSVGVTLGVEPGQIHALLGPNGAGKTTLLRILSGLVTPDEGSVQLNGELPQAARQFLGLVPAGDRSFYLRISALENLVFFGRLHGLRRRDAVNRAPSRPGGGRARSRGAQAGRAALQGHAAPAGAGTRAPLRPGDPAGRRSDTRSRPGRRRDACARSSQALPLERSIAVLWTTQRLEEIAGFADKVTLLDVGRTRFCGSVDDLIAHSLVRRYVLTIADGRARP